MHSQNIFRIQPLPYSPEFATQAACTVCWWVTVDRLARKSTWPQSRAHTQPAATCSSEKVSGSLCVCALSVSETAATATGRTTIVRGTCRNLQLSELRFSARLGSQLWAPPAVSAFLRHQALLGGRDIRARVAPGHHDHHHLHFYIFRQCRISPTTQAHMVLFPTATGEKPEIPTLNQQSLAQCSFRPI